MNNIKILHLTLKKKWFDLIASGEKTTEYRENKLYWQKRLFLDNGKSKKFDIVCFKNGYGNVPSIDVKIDSITLNDTKAACPIHGEILFGELVISIKLGKILCRNLRKGDRKPD